MTVLVALCIVLTIRLVGIMLLMSMMSLPVITAEVWCRRFVPVAVVSAFDIACRLCYRAVYICCRGCAVFGGDSALLAAAFVVAEIVQSLKNSIFAQLNHITLMQFLLRLLFVLSVSVAALGASEQILVTGALTRSMQTA